MNQESYLILGHNAFVRLFPADNKVVITDTILIKYLPGSENEISLKLNPNMIVSDVLQKNSEIFFEQKGEILKIGNLKKDCNEIVLNYSGYISLRSEFSRMNEKFAVIHESEIFPIGTESYAKVRLSIQSPIHWDIVAIGEVVRRTEKKDSAITVFVSSEKVQTLGWICGGEYSVNDNSDTDVKLSTYLYGGNSSFSQQILVELSAILKTYSEKFSKYRFKKLAIVEVDDWVAGKSVLAAAYPSVILVKKQAFQDIDPYNNVCTILPHEVAHQWWSISVFVDKNDAALLSEGFCEYSSVLFSEWTRLSYARSSLKNHPLLRPLIVRASSNRDLPLNEKTDLRSMPTYYLKGAYVHSMLRSIMGDTGFFYLLTSFAQEYFLKTVTSKDYQTLAEKIYNKKLDWFFKEWTEEADIPKLKLYRVKTEYQDSQWITHGRIRLIGYEKKWTTPVELTVVADSVMKREAVWIGMDTNNVYRNEVAFTFTTNSKPIKVLIDPDGKLLKYQKLPVKLSDLREPAEGVMIVGTMENSEKLLTLARRDSVEMDKAGWLLRIIADTSATLADFQNDRVFLYGKCSENKIAGDAAKKFPFNISNDSVLIDGSMYSDSVGLIQVIENPYRAQGLMCWVVALTQVSDPYLLPYDASYVVADGQKIIHKGNWEIKDEDLEVEIK
jgi:hypothetical protein